MSDTDGDIIWSGVVMDTITGAEGIIDTIGVQKM